MGCNKRAAEPAPPSLSEALLFTTLCIIGLPVEVQVKDGSLYSGIFHTACVDKKYGVVLKKARKIGRGNDGTNLAIGAVIDTLVVLSGDLVQVVVKDLLLTAEGIVGNFVGNGVEAASGAAEPRPCNGDSERDPKSSASVNDAPPRILDKNGGKWSLCMPNKNENSKIRGGLSERKVLANSLEKLQESEDGNQDSTCSKKEFKLNPGAKVFLPSFGNPRSAPAAQPTIANLDYVSNIPPMMPIAGAQSSLESSSFASRSSLPSKLVQYSNLVAGHSGVSAQYSRPIVGYAGTRQHPVRLSGQFHPVQAGPTYVHPNSQTVMVGRLAPLMYVHPVSQDAIQGTSFLSQGSTHPLLAPYQANVPKLQGSAAQSLQLCVIPPLVADGGLPFAVPSHLPFSQPLPAIRAISVPGGNAFFGS